MLFYETAAPRRTTIPETTRPARPSLMIRRATLFSPAKINLHLTVAGKRPDGFHEIVSLVAPLDFGDTIDLAVNDEAPGISLTSDEPQVPQGAENIAVRAAAAFMEKTGSSKGVSIVLQKKTPMGAGLGGGSSNAATVLTGLNELHEFPLSDGELNTLAADLGSDCPLFLAGRPCVVRGRGEIVEPANDALCKRFARQRVLLFKPDFSINTGWAYEKLAGSRLSIPTARQARKQIDTWIQSDDGLESVLFNNFEEVVFHKFVALPEVIKRLNAEQSVKGGLLSGSGSACFVLLREGESPERAVEIVRETLGETAFCQPASLA
jgi:4-diphosphocytidyl-2-C-methyl-D-erythritol kinase